MLSGVRPLATASCRNPSLAATRNVCQRCDATCIMQLTIVVNPGFECLTPSITGRPAMDEQRFDRVAKQLGQWGGSRRRALQVAGAVLANAGLQPTAFLAAAVSRAKRRCRRKGGHYLAQGTCHCVPTCSGNEPDEFLCRSDACYCYPTVEMTGFCTSITGSFTEAGCQTSAECENQTRRCVMVGFPSPAICTACPCDTTQACIDGFCRSTHCADPCPEGG